MKVLCYITEFNLYNCKAFLVVSSPFAFFYPMFCVITPAPLLTNIKIPTETHQGIRQDRTSKHERVVLYGLAIVISATSDAR